MGKTHETEKSCAHTHFSTETGRIARSSSFRQNSAVHGSSAQFTTGLDAISMECQIAHHISKDAYKLLLCLLYYFGYYSYNF